MTGSRILVQQGVADELRTRLSAALEAVKVGPAPIRPARWVR